MSIIFRQGSMSGHINILFILFLTSSMCVFVYHLYIDRWYQNNRFIITKHTSREPEVITKTVANSSALEQCSTQWEHKADINTVEIYQNFQFKTSPELWRNKKHFWNKTFEKRYKRLRSDPNRPLLQVFVVPHSHNDPGWLETFEDYYEWRTKYILRNIISSLEKYQNMTFIWSEVVFLEYWWNKATFAQQKALKNLVTQGRLEITTGGWVMPDEACTHIYALLDQYIEGHEWLKMNLGVTPKFGWSVDPFGHGPTVPYILDESGFNGTIIQRIHYAWKRWMAENQIQEFHWVQSWSSKNPDLLVHNMPFDIYSVLSSCGPHRHICSSFDFNHDIMTMAEAITDANLLRKSVELIEEYHRIGSLTSHNIVLVPLGDDFRYQSTKEFDKQYKNYTKLFNYINSHKDFFNAHVQFGTPSDYFRAVKARESTFLTLKGDFYVYSDIFTSGDPGYWSGYFSSRPYFKQLVRKLEHQLRTSEILYTLIFNSIEISKSESVTYKKFEKSYENLITARRLLGLVQHHDAITGTARMRVVENYGRMIVKSYYDCLRLQEMSLKMAMIPNSGNLSWPVLQSDLELDTYGDPVTKQILQIPETRETKVVLFNSLSEARIDVVNININNPNIIVFDEHRNEIVPHQILPIILVNNTNITYVISDSVFKLIFIAKLPALTAVTYTVTQRDQLGNLSEIACSTCFSLHKSFNIEKLPLGDFILENWFYSLVIDRTTGFLSKVKLKHSDTEHKVEIKFGAYKSAELQSGPYLFKPDPDEPEIPVLKRYLKRSDLLNHIIIISGPILTEIKVVFYPFLLHSVKLYKVGNHALSRGIHVENDVDFGNPPKHRETELFMRIHTDIQNTNPKIEFYTDQNGFQYQKRVRVDNLGIEGNYYPITTMAWIQDNNTRMTYITNHAQGAASFVPGQLEVMLERRMIYDDERGLGEGLFDNKPTIFKSLLTFEKIKPQTKTELNKYQLPSRFATYLSHILNYPINIYFYNEEEIKPYVKFVENFPKDLYLLTLRTISNEEIQTIPSPSCYMILHRIGYDCQVGSKIKRNKKARFSSEFKMNNIIIENISSVTLTGLNKYSDISAMEEIQLNPLELKTILLKFQMK